MVTWGQNQVRTFPTAAPAGGSAGGQPQAPAFGSAAPTPGTPAPAGNLFGASTPAPAPTGGGLFGSSTPAPAPTTGAFGTTPAPAGGAFGTTPAPAPGGLFGGATPAPAGGNLFGSSGALFGSTSPASASTGGLFGSTPAPAPSGGLFASSQPSYGLFGTPAPAPSSGIFGSTPAPTPSVGPQIPAQAAMQAHMDAEARQRTAQLQAVLEKHYAAYTGAPTAEKFVCIVYNDITPEQRQLQWMMGNQRAPPPKPPHVSEKDWLDAVVRNPDPDSYMPCALVGAEALQSRLAFQQDRANVIAQGVETLKSASASLQQSCDRAQSDVLYLAKMYEVLCNRLLQVMRKVEIARCMNLPLQPDEATLKRRLLQVSEQVNQVAKVLATAQAQAKHQSQLQSMPIVNVPDERELSRVLKGHREALTEMAKVMEKDKRDLDLLRQDVTAKVPLPPR